MANHPYLQNDKLKHNCHRLSHTKTISIWHQTAVVGWEATRRTPAELCMLGSVPPPEYQIPLQHPVTPRHHVGSIHFVRPKNWINHGAWDGCRPSSWHLFSRGQDALVAQSGCTATLSCGFGRKHPFKPYPVDWLQPQFAVGTAACTTRELSKLRRFWWFLLWHPTFAAQVMPATWERPPLSRGLPVLLSQLQWLLSQWVLSLCLLAVHPWLFAKLKFEKMEPDLIIWHTEMDIKVTQWPLYKTYWGFCNNTATFCPNPH